MSAEAFGEWRGAQVPFLTHPCRNQRLIFEPPVYPKTPGELVRGFAFVQARPDPGTLGGSEEKLRARRVMVAQVKLLLIGSR